MRYLHKSLMILTIGVCITLLMVFSYFKVTAPEGCSVLQHYFFGNGEPLVLKSDYLPKSPVIKQALKEMYIGEVKKIAFKQKKDWRLSYALNPFQLKKNKNGFEIYQYIKFDTTGEVATTINLAGFKFKFKDSWVHFFKTTPFMVYYQYRNTTTN